MRDKCLPIIAPAGLATVMLLTSSWAAPRLLAKENPAARPDIRNQRATAIREPCVATAEEVNPDVFRRPCFVDALASSRQAFGAYAGFKVIGKAGLKVAPADRSGGVQDQTHLQNLLLNVIQSRYLPVSWQQAHFYELLACPEKPITEVRVPGGAPTVVGMKRECAGVHVDELEAWAIEGEWTSEGIDVVPLMWQRQQPRKTVVIRLRLHGDDRLAIRPRPQDRHAPGSRRDFFEPEAFDELFTSVFRVPFETTEDWFVDGYDAEYEGVRVFHGYVVAGPRKRPWVGGDDAPQQWWEQMRLLVTDSDPQYFCVEIILRAGDELPNESP